MKSPSRAAAVGLAVLVIFTFGCAREEPVAPPRFSVRLLTSPNLSGRWEAAAEQGLGLIAAELDADVARHRVGDGHQGRGQLAAEGEQGADLVFCVGGGFEKALYAEAGGFPETAFVLLPGRARAANVAGIDFLSEGAGYLAGVVAATVARAPRSGVLRGVGGPWLEALERGFATGFEAHNRRAVVATEYGVEGVWALNITDVDVALYASDGPEPGVMEAAREAGLRLIVTDPGLMKEFPDVVVAAIDIDVAEAMLRVAREVRDGTFVGQVYSFDLGSGILDVTLGGELDPAVLETASTALEEGRAEVMAGLIEIDQLGL